MKPKTTPASGGGALPSQETLATIAAAMPHREPEEAVRAALALWREAGAALEPSEPPHDKVPLPARFPASLADFLRLVVAAPNARAGKELLRLFHRDELRRLYGHERLLTVKDRAEIEDRAAAEVAGWEKNRFDTQEKWESLARRFLAWRKADISAKRREAGTTRPAARAEANTRRKAEVREIKLTAEGKPDKRRGARPPVAEAQQASVEGTGVPLEDAEAAVRGARDRLAEHPTTDPNKPLSPDASS